MLAGDGVEHAAEAVAALRLWWAPLVVTTRRCRQGPMVTSAGVRIAVGELYLIMMA